MTRWVALIPVVFLTACTPIGDHWSPGAIIFTVVLGGVACWGIWRYATGGDQRRERRQDRRDDRRE